MTRVIMFPAVGVKNENRFIDVLVEALRDSGVDVVGWRKHLSFQKGDVFHVHWPEIVPEIIARKHNRLRGEWISFQFFRTIRRVKKSGGRVVWTAHDLTPHWKSLRESAPFIKFMPRFLAEVDIVLSLTEAGIEQIRQEIPALAAARVRVARHPHYRGILGHGAYSPEERKRLGLDDGQCIFAFIGTLRANKRPELVAEAFKKLPPDNNFLIMAGAASEEMAEKIRNLTQGVSNIRLDLRRIPEEEILRLYAATDILVFPGTDYFNSGTIYTALSLNVPVIAAWSPANAEVQKLVGADWLYLYQGDFSEKALEEGSRTLVKRKEGAVCDLSRFAPEVCAQEHVDAYRSPL